MSDAEQDADAEAANGEQEKTGMSRVCRMTGRKQGLVGKYDIWLCRQSFREVARDMGFEKYD